MSWTILNVVDAIHAESVRWLIMRFRSNWIIEAAPCFSSFHSSSSESRPPSSNHDVSHLSASLSLSWLMFAEDPLFLRFVRCVKNIKRIGWPMICCWQCRQVWFNGGSLLMDGCPTSERCSRFFLLWCSHKARVCKMLILDWWNNDVWCAVSFSNYRLITCFLSKHKLYIYYRYFLNSPIAIILYVIMH